MHRRLVKLGRPWALAQQALLDDPQKDAQRTVQRRPIALHEVAQPLGHRQHPLAHRQVRKNMVHQVRRRLLHAPRVARGADCATLAREGYRLVMRAVLAPHPRKTVGQDAALQVFAKRLRYIGQWGVLVALAIDLAGAEERKPGLQMTGHGAVQHRALGMARVVELGSGRRR
jgi:hypothetical protein